MNYGAEVYNYAISANNDSLEIIHRKFCKFVLGVSQVENSIAITNQKI